MAHTAPTAPAASVAERDDAVENACSRDEQGEHANLDDARRYLDALEPGGRFNFRTFGDTAEAKAEDKRRYKAGEKPHYARTRRGTLDEHVDELTRLNGEGAGAFVVVQRGGDSDPDIDGVRAVFVDVDDPDADVDALRRCDPPPHLIIESSAGKHHAYWLVRDDFPVDDFRGVQHALVDRFGGDRKCVNPSRVMRLPGFRHCKGEPFQSRIVDDRVDELPRYTHDEIVAAFPPVETSGRDSRPDVGRTIDGKPDLEAMRDTGLDPQPDPRRPGLWYVRCVWHDAHTTDDDGTGTAYYEAHSNGYAGAAYVCQHESCQPDGRNHDIHDVRRALGVEDVSRDGVMRDAEALDRSSTADDVKDVLRRAAAGLDVVEQDEVVDTVAQRTKFRKATLRPMLAGYAKREAGEQGGRGESAADKLVRIATEHYRLGVSTEGEPFAVPREPPRVVRMLRGSDDSLRAELARDFYRDTGRAAPQQALTDALAVLDGMAREAEPETLCLRVARDADGVVWLDLGDTTGRAVRVDANGWTVEAEPVVLFKRTAATGALPKPERGGALDELWRLVNVAEADRPLCAAWIVADFWPDIPHPIPALQGEQGTGKTGAASRLRATIDPSPVAVGSVPRDEEQWINTAYAQYVVGLDNVSTVPGWLSDALCRASTGDGDLRRRKYTDAGVVVFRFRRAPIMTSIDLGAVAGDLGDRLLPIDLERIDPRDRRRESQLEPEWQAAHARVLGAVLDLVAAVERDWPDVVIDEPPRMADFAYVLAAVDRVQGTSGYARYVAKHDTMARDAVHADPFAVAIAQNVPGGFNGTAGELLDRIPDPDPRPRGWPATAREATARLHRLAPAMRAAGWTVDEDGGRNRAKALRWTLRPAEGAGEVAY